MHLYFIRGDKEKTMKKGSITIEAAMVLPIFMFFFLGISYIFGLISLQYNVQTALSDTANQMSLVGYFKEEENIALLQADFCMNLKNKYYGKNCILGGIVSLGQSYYKEKDITLIADYIIKIPVPFWNHFFHHEEQIARTRKFVGRDRREETSDMIKDTKVRYVYITENGRVYHESKDCSHLRRKIEKIEKGSLQTIRNESGGKYYPCELCLKKKNDKEAMVFYITRDGNRYHKSSECSGLKRTIKRVPYESVKTWRACKRCG